MRAAFRVDASRAIGTGHLRRSIALAEAVHALGGEIRFLARDLALDVSALMNQHGFGIDLLPAPGDSERIDHAVAHAAWAGIDPIRDAQETAALLADWRTDWVVIDSYAFDFRWHQAVRAALGCRIAQIDDLADRRIAPDLLIDHTYARDHAAKYSGCLVAPARILGGPNYALLDAQFATAPRYQFRSEVRSVGIFMGGIDAGNYSTIALDGLDRAGFDGPVEIVTTSFNPQLEALRSRTSARHLTTLTLDLPDLAAFFARHDLQVGAGGGASWERCCIGVPTMLVVVAANQNAVVPRLEEESIVVAAKPTPEAIASEIANLLEDTDKRSIMASRGRALVDGQGAMRVAKELQSCA